MVYSKLDPSADWEAYCNDHPEPEEVPMNRCISCGSSNVDADSISPCNYQAYCDCGVSGPIKSTLEEAISAWNSMATDGSHEYMQTLIAIQYAIEYNDPTELDPSIDYQAQLIEMIEERVK